MNKHKVYNLSSINYSEITSKNDFIILKKTLHMKSENVIMSDFSLHYFLQAKLLYFKQYLLTDDLLSFICLIDVTLSLL